MKHLMSLALISTLSPLAQATPLEIDPAHTSVGFEIKHLVVSTVHGNFADFNGKVEWNEKDITQSNIQFTVKVDSINTSNAKRDGHLRSPDFFDTAKYPTAEFKSSRITSKGKNKYLLEGDLTLHGISKPTRFEMLFLGKAKDPYGVEKLMFQASTELVRKDFGLTYNAVLESGGLALGEKVKLIVDAQAAPVVISAK